MTDDVTRGLGLLADEAEPAPVDTDAVIAAAAALSRNRAILTTALVTLIVLCALVVTLGAVTAPARTADRPKASHPPVLGTELARRATADEQSERAARLHAMAVRAFDRFLPRGWTPSTFDFTCDQLGCWAEGEIKDDAGPVSVSVYVGGDYGTSSCFRPECTRRLLRDGTLVSLQKFEDTDSAMPGSVPVMRVNLGAVRPDGTSLGLSVDWPLSRTAPVLTDDQWRRFATAFTY
jgi:hypothetical protein